MLRAVDAERFADERVGNLSGGEQQRVMIAHALISSPRLLLLDEPLANLDIRSAQEIIALLARVCAERGVSVLISAHEMNPLLPVMDSVVYLAGGRAASGTTGEVVRSEVLSELYGHHVDVIRVHGRILVVAGTGDGLDIPSEAGAAACSPTSGQSPAAGESVAGGARLGEQVGHGQALSHEAPSGPGLRPGESRAGEPRARPGAAERQVVTGLLHLLFAPGFFSSAPVRLALLTGGVAALVSGAVGAFTVLRGQSYAGHALADISVTGGSGSYLLGISPLLGFAGTGVLAAGVMDMIGIRRPRGRDLATGIVRGAGLGIAALLLYWDTTHTAATGAAVTILFGSMFTLSPTVVPLVIACGAVALAIVVVLYRPLLLSSVSADLAAARGIRVRAVGLACLLAIALAVSLSALTVGHHPVHRAARRPGGHRAADHPPARPRDRGCRPDRGGRDLAGHRAGLRQLHLAAPARRLAGELLRGRADLRRLPARAARRPRPPSRPAAPGPARCRRPRRPSGPAAPSAPAGR